MQRKPTVPEERWTELRRSRRHTGDELVLYSRGSRYELRFNGRELMSDRAHWSESALGALACDAIQGPKPRILVGGLGMGYTLRAALDVLPASAGVIVAELMPEVVAWNRGPLSRLAGHPLEDRRVTVELCDVACVLRQSGGWFDAVILDVDNGPDDVTLAVNRQLYSADGLALIRWALRFRGKLAVWSASRSETFASQLACSGFTWEAVEVAARGAASDPKHTIYLAEVRESICHTPRSCIAVC